ncbi:MAG TPA: response regulator [Planctomycetes bacterium]|nr:response regulator [Planctomycetota bacterium]HIK59516.1 response regulator [Planctomycetota bacterium]
MRLTEITSDMMSRAINIYFEHAFPKALGKSPARSAEELKEHAGLDQPLALFDAPEGRSAGVLPRHVVRLGNHGYPFMKLVVQEYILDGEYFFSVDTHDALKVSPEMPDYEAWCEVRRENRRLKETIEEAWAGDGLPTHQELRSLAEGIAGTDGQDRCSGRIMVVDDERDVALGLAALLRGKGFEVETAFDGQEVVDRLKDGEVPDLLLLDYSMPELDGEEVMLTLRADPEFAQMPILLATASNIDLETMTRANGLLRKPYTRGVLFQMIQGLIG